MLLKKVMYVTQFISDQDKALDFYTRLLEFEKRVDNPTPDGGPRFLTVGVRGARVSARALAWKARGGPGVSRPNPGDVHDRDAGLPEGVRGIEIARRDVRNGRARVSVGLYRRVRGS